MFLIMLRLFFLSVFIARGYHIHLNYLDFKNFLILFNRVTRILHQSLNATVSFVVKWPSH